MKRRPSYRRFQPELKIIEELEKNNSNFKRIVSEYESIAEELAEIENNKKNELPDEFIFALQLQTECLEEEIKNWLMNVTPKDS